MKVGLRIRAVELDGNDGPVMTFWDGTTGEYVVEKLLQLRSVRERVTIKDIQKGPIGKRHNHDNPEGEAC